jgi:prepilin-type N-terminal cleavage/methylation domain-containing protein
MLRRKGYTLVEILVVVAIIAIVLAIGVTSLRALTGGVQENAARTTLASLLASARAEATGTQQIVGVRFEQDAKGYTYGVIVHLAPDWHVWPSRSNDFITMVAPKGREPVRFPKGVEFAAADELSCDRDSDGDVDADDANLALSRDILDATTFTILFAPSGQVMVRNVCVTQRCVIDPTDGVIWDNATDTIFQAPDGPDSTDYMLNPRPPAETGLSVEVSWLLRGDGRWPNACDGTNLLGYESSVVALYVYDQVARREAGSAAWTNYLKNQAPAVLVQVNPYTGLIQKPSANQ